MCGQSVDFLEVERGVVNQLPGDGRKICDMKTCNMKICDMEICDMKM